MTFLLQFDGGSRGNPGCAGSGYVLYDGKHVLHEGIIPCGINTNNFAEYTGVLEGLKYFIDRDLQGTLLIQGDSKLVIEHLKGTWKCKAPNLIPLFIQCRECLSRIPSYTLEWIPREKNLYADALSNKAMDALNDR